jgi:glycosyltransferase involved in cell wall biosynthesis
MAGPGNASRSLAALAEGHFNESIGHAGYSDQLFRVCQDLGAEALAICTSDQARDARVGPIRLERHPDPLVGTRGAHYHWAHVRLAHAMLQVALRFRANVVVTPFEPYPFLLEPLWRRGIDVVLALHCTLWPVFRPRRANWRVFAPLLRRAFKDGITAVLSASDCVTNQVREIGGPGCPVVEFMPTFRPEAYPLLPDAPRAKPFRVMFVGRCERDKGVFTLVEVARLLQERGRADVVFDICGDGSSFAELKASVEQHHLESIVRLHGWCLADRLVEISRGAHVFVVPTTTEFNEGFNHVVIEGLLAGRPVITSPVCPAASYAGAAVTLVKPDDPASYLAAILALADDPQRYQELRAVSRTAGERFFDPSWGFGAGLRSILTSIASGERPRDRRIDPSFCLPEGRNNVGPYVAA